jgi:hypothetical protein
MGPMVFKTRSAGMTRGIMTSFFKRNLTVKDDVRAINEIAFTPADRKKNFKFGGQMKEQAGCRLSNRNLNKNPIRKWSSLYFD